MKKKLIPLIAVLICAVACAISLAACNEGKKPDSGNNGGNPQETVAVERIELSQSEFTLEVGKQSTLIATVYPENATNKNILWNSSNKEIADVSNGVVTAQSVGNATITASVGDVKAECLVTVREAVKPDVAVDSISLNKPVLELSVGDEETLTVNIEPAAAKDNKIIWSVSPEGVVSVDNGKITAIGDGTAFVRASAGGKTSMPCEVRVTSGTAGLRINVYDSEGYAVVDGIMSGSFEGEVVIPSTYSGYPVTAISDRAFENNSGITGVTIPDSIKTIGHGAFNNCSALKTVTMTDSVESIGSWAFGNCVSLESIVLSKNIKVIEENTFNFCAKLNNVVIPDGVTKIDGYSFAGCGTDYPKFTVSVPDSVTEFGRAFEGCTLDYNVHNHVNYLGNETNPYVILMGVEKGLEDTSALTIQQGTKIIDRLAFSDCTFESITIPSGVIAVGTAAFQNCWYLTEVNLPESLVSIGDNAFSRCANLASIRLPENLANIGGMAFFRCESLKSIAVDEQNPNYCSQNGAVYNKEKTELIAVPAGMEGTLTVADGVTTIENSVLIGCNKLTSIVIPASVTAIQDYQFDCVSLESITVAEGNQNYTSQNGILYNKAKTAFVHIPESLAGDIVIPNGITTIAEWAFADRKMTSIVIPDSVTSIGQAAFRNCNNLQKMTVPFVGGSMDARYYGDSENANRATAHFGYIFGAIVVVTSNSYGLPNNKNVVPASLKEVTVTKSIGTSYYAFYGCENIEKIAFTASDASATGYVIGRGSFEECHNLKTLILAHGVSEIEADAFSFCNSLTTLVLPDSVTRVTAYTGTGNLAVYYTGSTWPFTTSFTNSTHYVRSEWEYVDGVPTVKS